MVAGKIKASGGLILLGFMVWIFGLILTFILFKKAQAVSPFRTAHILLKRLTRPCEACGKTISSKALVCHHCGKAVTLAEEDITLKA